MSSRIREHYIIDGYNVIHAWPELSTLVGDLSEARDRLIQIMTEYGAYENYDIIVVFDALYTADEAHEEKRGSHVTILFTAAGETADSCIERLAYELVRARREVHVVTSDGAEQSVILGAGAYRLPPGEFRKRVRRVKEKLRRDYLEAPIFPLTRNEIRSHIDKETAEKLDRLRKNHDW